MLILRIWNSISVFNYTKECVKWALRKVYTHYTNKRWVINTFVHDPIHIHNTFTGHKTTILYYSLNYVIHIHTGLSVLLFSSNWVKGVGEETHWFATVSSAQYLPWGERHHFDRTLNVSHLRYVCIFDWENESVCVCVCQSLKHLKPGLSSECMKYIF